MREHGTFAELKIPQDIPPVLLLLWLSTEQSCCEYHGLKSTVRGTASGIIRLFLSRGGPDTQILNSPSVVWYIPIV